ncbi:MAG: hypothetical protein HC862_03840 [Scytonema sp. RU_4_4]|nr:hypothetical protein [Scytonema sp. RU_4_4]NJR75383.1 hypothetical protein [Scytonema sp. CRU_2_7]
MSGIPEEFLSVVTAKHRVSQSELDALRLALDGHTAEAIAETLGISPPAVRKRLGSIYQKFDIPGHTHGKLEILRNILSKEYSLAKTSDVQPQRDWSQLGEQAGVDDLLCFCGRQNDMDILKTIFRISATDW